jgi:uncharacterized protein (DUF58 family)
MDQVVELRAVRLAPATRLLLLVAAVVVPCSALAVIPGWGVAAWIGIAVVALALILDAAWGRRALAGIDLRTPDLVRTWKGRAASLALTVGNQSQRGRAVRIALEFPDGIGAENDELTAMLPDGSEYSRIEWPFTPEARGRHGITSCALETRSPWGLWSVARRGTAALEIRVYPNLTAARQRSARNLERGQLGMHVLRQVGKGREFEKLREYAAGDSFEDVDWKATARRGRPITRVFQVERTQEVYMILDASRLSARPLSSETGDTILERNITASLLVALEADRQGDLFGMVTFSDRVSDFIRARNGKAHYSTCREALCGLEPRKVAPDFDEVCTLLRLRLRKRSLLVFLTELDDPALAESFLKNVALLRRRHLVVVGMTRPASARPLFAELDVAGVDEVYNKLAGHILWNKLRELGKILQRQGVRFALLDPETAGVELASLYRGVKQRQLL